MATCPRGLIRQATLFRRCGSYPDKINSLSPTVNYANYQNFTFARPCGRLPADFPGDQFSYLQSSDDFNAIIPIEAFDTTVHGANYYSGPVGSVLNDQRFVGWMVSSAAPGEHERLPEALGEGAERRPRGHLQPRDPKPWAKKSSTRPSSKGPKRS